MRREIRFGDARASCRARVLERVDTGRRGLASEKGLKVEARRVAGRGCRAKEIVDGIVGVARSPTWLDRIIARALAVSATFTVNRRAVKENVLLMRVTC